MKKIFLKKFTIYFLIFSFLICIMYSFFNDINNSKIKTTEVKLREISTQSAISFRIKLENSISYIEGISNLIHENDYDNENIIIDIFNSFVERNIFDYIFMVDGDKKISSNYNINIEYDSNDLEYFEEKLDENNTLFLINLDGNIMLVFNSKTSNDIDIYGLYHINRFERLINTNEFYNVQYTYIFNSDGNFIFKSSEYKDIGFGENIFDVYKNSRFMNGNSFDNVSDGINNHKEGFTYFSHGGKRFYSYYTPIGVSDLYILSIVPKCSVDRHIISTKIGAFILIFCILVIFIIFEFVIYMNRSRLNKEISNSNTVMKINNERYKIASNLADCVVFEYIIAQRKLVFKNDIHTQYFNTKEIDNIPLNVLSFWGIEKEYKSEIIECFNAMLKGEKYVETEFRIYNYENSFKWVKMKMTNIFDKEGLPVKAVGTILNITDIKETEIKYIKIAQYKDIILSNCIYSCELNVTNNSIKNLKFNGRVIKNSKFSYVGFIDDASEKYVLKDDKESFKRILSLENIIESYNNNIREIRMRYRTITCNSKVEFWAEVFVYLTKDDKTNDVVGLLFIKDIDDIVREELELKYDAEIDGLTGIYNKSTTERKIKECINENIEGMLMIIDLDGFKYVNDIYSHMAGDYVLVEFSSKLKDLFRTSDIIGRIGGDEFCVYIKNTTDLDLVNEKANKILDILKQEYNYKGNILPVSGSIGVAIYPKDGNNYTKLFENADKALYNSKRSGKARYSIYE